MEFYFVFQAPPSVFLNGLSVMSLVLSAICGFWEIKGKNMPYSKFFNISNTKVKKAILVPSKTGMLICYTPAFLLSLASFFFLDQAISVRNLLLKSALALHFFKREFEVYIIYMYVCMTLIVFI